MQHGRQVSFAVRPTAKKSYFTFSDTYSNLQVSSALEKGTTFWNVVEVKLGSIAPCSATFAYASKVKSSGSSETRAGGRLSSVGRRPERKQNACEPRLRQRGATVGSARQRRRSAVSAQPEVGRRGGRQRHGARHHGHRHDLARSLARRRPALTTGRLASTSPPAAAAAAAVAAQSATEHRAEVATAQAVDDEVGRRVERDEQVAQLRHVATRLLSCAM